MCFQKRQISLRIRTVGSESSLSAVETLHLCLSKMLLVKILIWLLKCAGSSESSLEVDVRSMFSDVAADIVQRHYSEALTLSWNGVGILEVFF